MEAKILGIAIRKLTEAFDNFISSCMDEHGNPVQPNYRSLMRARSCLPNWCKNTLVKGD